jgi:hypothetical protein
MIVDSEPRQGRWSRLLLLAGGVGLAWCAFSILGQSSAASAAENDDPSGLLGTISSTVQQTTSAVSGVIDAVEPVVIEVVHTVAPPAPAPAPAPPQAPPVSAPTVHSAVQSVVQGVGNAATSTVSGVTQTLTTTLDGTAGTVDAVTGVVAETTTGVISGLSATQTVAPVLETVHGLPIVGLLTDRLGLADTLGAVVTVADDLLATLTGTTTAIVGAPGQSGNGVFLPLPGLLPLTGEAAAAAPASSVESAAPSLTTQQALTFAGLFAGALVAGAVVPVASAAGTGSGRWGGSPLAPFAPSSPSLIMAGMAAAAALWAALVEFSWFARPGGHGLVSLADDALPGAPVFATDVAPD